MTIAPVQIVTLPQRAPTSFECSPLAVEFSPHGDDGGYLREHNVASSTMRVSLRDLVDELKRRHEREVG